MTDTEFSRGIRRVRRTIWSSAFYRRARRIVADLTRPIRRIELALLFRQDLTEPVKVYDANVKIEVAQASPDDVEQAASLNPVGSRREVFRWRLENGCLCFVARAASELVAFNWVRLRPGVDDGDLIALADREAFHFDSYAPVSSGPTRARPLLCRREPDRREHTRRVGFSARFGREYSELCIRRASRNPTRRMGLARL